MLVSVQVNLMVSSGGSAMQATSHQEAVAKAVGRPLSSTTNVNNIALPDVL